MKDLTISGKWSFWLKARTNRFVRTYKIRTNADAAERIASVDLLARRGFSSPSLDLLELRLNGETETHLKIEGADLQIQSGTATYSGEALKGEYRIEGDSQQPGFSIRHRRVSKIFVMPEIRFESPGIGALCELKPVMLTKLTPGNFLRAIFVKDFRFEHGWTYTAFQEAPWLTDDLILVTWLAFVIQDAALEISD